MKVPNTGITSQEVNGERPSQAALMMAAAIMAKNQQLDPDEALGLKGANADAARWRK